MIHRKAVQPGVILVGPEGDRVLVKAVRPNTPMTQHSRMANWRWRYPSKATLDRGNPVVNLVTAEPLDDSKATYKTTVRRLARWACSFVPVPEAV